MPNLYFFREKVQVKPKEASRQKYWMPNCELVIFTLLIYF